MPQVVHKSKCDQVFGLMTSMAAGNNSNLLYPYTGNKGRVRNSFGWVAGWPWFTNQEAG